MAPCGVANCHNVARGSMLASTLTPSPGVQHARVQSVQGICEPRQVGSIGAREHVDVDRGAYVSVGLNG